MNRYCNCNCCNCLCWFRFSAEELGALKTTLNDWQHHQQLEALTLEAGNNNPLYCRQPEADNRMQTAGGRQPDADSRRQIPIGCRQPEADNNRMQTAGGRQPCTESQQTWASHIFRDQSALSFTQCGHLAPNALIQQTDCLQNWVYVLLTNAVIFC